MFANTSAGPPAEDALEGFYLLRGYREDGKTPFIAEETSLLGRVMTLKEFATEAKKNGITDGEAHYWSPAPLPDVVTHVPPAAPVKSRSHASAPRM